MNSLIEGHEKLIEKYADDVVRHCGRARLMLMKAHVFRSKLKRFHRRIQERHRRLASIFPERRHPLRIAHAVYVRAVFTALWTANRTLRMFFSYPEWFTD